MQRSSISVSLSWLKLINRNHHSTGQPPSSIHSRNRALSLAPSDTCRPNRRKERHGRSITGQTSFHLAAYCTKRLPVAVHSKEWTPSTPSTGSFANPQLQLPS